MQFIYRTTIALSFAFVGIFVQAQALKIPSSTNVSSSVGRRLGATEININWNAPGVKGREGKIWGTDIAPYGFTVLGFGSDVPSPWRAGADENTTIQFSTDVLVNGKKLNAGKYGFFIALYPDSCILIFNKNNQGWGSYFYNDQLDVLRVKTVQQKNQAQSTELLEYSFSNQKNNSVDIAMSWERWRIPFTIEVDVKQNTLALIQMQMSGALGFDPPSLEAAAQWCLTNQVNYDQALKWINSASSPSLGGVNNFNVLSIKAGLLDKTGKQAEAKKIMDNAIDIGGIFELHQYGRKLLSEGKKAEAMAVFEKNYTKNKGAWPTNGGMMRGYAAMGNTAKALEHAKLALAQAPDEANKKNIANQIALLEQGKTLQ
jgi:tetratricopeptide (TPR) repeat protein